MAFTLYFQHLPKKNHPEVFKKRELIDKREKNHRKLTKQAKRTIGKEITVPAISINDQTNQMEKAQTTLCAIGSYMKSFNQDTALHFIEVQTLKAQLLQKAGQHLNAGKSYDTIIETYEGNTPVTKEVKIMLAQVYIGKANLENHRTCYIADITEEDTNENITKNIIYRSQHKDATETFEHYIKEAIKLLSNNTGKIKKMMQQYEWFEKKNTVSAENILSKITETPKESGLSTISKLLRI